MISPDKQRNEGCAPGTPVRVTATPLPNYLPVHHQSYEDDVVTFHLPAGTTLFGLYLGESQQGHQIRLVNGETWALPAQQFQLTPLPPEQPVELARLQEESARDAVDQATPYFYTPARDQTFEVVFAELTEKYHGGEGDLVQALEMLHRALTEGHAAGLAPEALAPLEWQVGFLWYVNDPTGRTTAAEDHINRALSVYEAKLLAGPLADTEKPGYLHPTALGLALLAALTQDLALIERLNYLAFLLEDTHPVKLELLGAVATILLHHGKTEAARTYASSAWQLYTRHIAGHGGRVETGLRDRLVDLDRHLGPAIFPRLPGSEQADGRLPGDPPPLTKEQQLLRQFGALSPQRQERVLDYIRWQLHQQAREG